MNNFQLLKNGINNPFNELKKATDNMSENIKDLILETHKLKLKEL